ncbi:MAG: Mov34/MPN/PAD-1 family protein [Colwellia sp.]|jgi:hypothetical protein
MSNSGLVVVECNAQKVLRAHRQIGLLKGEQGGILMGERRGDHIVITHASTPGKGDKSWYTGFIRSKSRHQRFIDRVYKETQGKSNYVGEWHSHPEPNPKPSVTDIVNWKRNLTESELYILTIVGQKNDWWGQILQKSITALNF